MAEDVINFIRSATGLVLKDLENGQAPFWELEAALDRVFLRVNGRRMSKLASSWVHRWGQKFITAPGRR
jgi:hypothetical protein